MTKEEITQREGIIADMFTRYISDNDRQYIFRELDIIKIAQIENTNELINNYGVGNELEDELSKASKNVKDVIVNYLEGVAFKSKGCADGENAMALLEKYNTH